PLRRALFLWVRKTLVDTQSNDRASSSLAGIDLSAWFYWRAAGTRKGPTINRGRNIDDRCNRCRVRLSCRPAPRQNSNRTLDSLAGDCGLFVSDRGTDNDRPRRTADW